MSTTVPVPENVAKGPAISLKARLMIAFCALAGIPALLVTVLQLQTGERNLVQTVNRVTDVGRAALESSSKSIADTSLNTLTETSDGLIRLSTSQIAKTSDTLMDVSRTKLQDASQKIIGLSQATNQRMARDLVALSRDAAGEISRDLMRLSADAHTELARTTAEIADKAVQANSQQLIGINERLADELSSYLAKANREAADDVSRRLLHELERDPLVNFRLLASLIGQTFAGGKITDHRDAYLIDVNWRGQVKASTRHKRGMSLAELEIVRRALNDPPEVAAQIPLISYRDGADTYLGVYTRKRDGGAVIVSYNLAKAQADMDQLGGLVKGSFEDLVAITTEGTRSAVSSTSPRIRAEADMLAQETARIIHQESEAVSQQFAQRMASQAVQTTQAATLGMTRQADHLSGEALTLMQGQSERIIRRALTEMAPIGPQSVAEAVQTMTPQAQRAVSTVKARLGPQIEAASLAAAEAILPEAAAAQTAARIAGLQVGLAVLVLAIGLGIGASFFLSRQIADPIEVEKTRKEAEIARFGKELEIATRIQTALIPTDMAIQDYDLTLSLVTATEVGGDLIDYLPQSDGGFWLAVGDVTGHGLTPGLIMMMAQSIMTGLVLDDPKIMPSELLVRLNRALYQNVKYRLGNDNYMTLQVIHHEGGGRFVAAGMHCDVLIYRAASRTVERHEVPGVWTGLMPDVAELTEDYRFELAANDVLLLYTDGLIEAMNAAGEQYDMDRLEAALIRYGDLPVGTIEAKLLAEVRAWMHEQKDDISIAVLRRHAVGVPAKQAIVV